MKWMCINCNAQTDAWIKYCPRCGESNVYIPVAHKPSDFLLSDDTVKSTAELVKEENQFLPLSGRWIDIFDSLPVTSFKVLVYGSPGAGKTTFLLNLSNFLSRFHNVYFNALEEGFSTSMIDRLKRLEIINPNLYIACQSSLAGIIKFVSEKQIGYLVIDPINCLSLSMDELSRLNKEYELSLLLSCHITKDLTPKGNSGWLHFVDIIIEIEPPKLIVHKNRFGLSKEVNYET